MKRIFLSILLTIITVGAVVATNTTDSGNGIDWNKTTHDFGTIHSSGGKVRAEYTFTNSTSEPAAVLSVTNGGCGCTVPSYPKQPIAAGQKGKITITFDPSRFKGEFKRQVSVTIMSEGRKIKAKLKFSGNIIPD